MPNSRRRKFSVQNDVGRKSIPKSAGAGPGSIKSTFNPSFRNLAETPGKYRSKMFPNRAKAAPLEIVTEIAEKSTSIQTVVTRPCNSASVDKDVTASSSNIDLFNLMQLSENVVKDMIAGSTKVKHVERTEHQRERPRQHRVKVRSPKRQILLDSEQPDVCKVTVASDAIDWEHEMEVFNITSPPAVCVSSPMTVAPIPPVDDRASEHSLDDMCRICHGGECLSLELGPLISACNCRGTVGRVHVRCLERWLTESGKSRCELCGTRYATRRVHRYGVPRALLMWVLSQNAKQLMVDSLGIMLMSPLAVLAAWLSGRTLAGLMAQDGHATPWPLASTFVLACMTLVCYYCWIVSAATRHALGWWVWYRSQYEVRLLPEAEES